MIHERPREWSEGTAYRSTPDFGAPPNIGSERRSDEPGTALLPNSIAVTDLSIPSVIRSLESGAP